MGYRIIPMETYPRRAHFAYFSTMAHPYAGVTVSVEITHFLESVQEKGSPFFLSFLYCVSRAANQVPELRQRIWKGEIIEYQNCPTSHTVALPDGTYCYRIYLYRNGNVDKEVSLSSVSGFETVPPVVHTGSGKRQFVIDRPNIANNLDYSIPFGIPVYANAIDNLKGVDVAFDSYVNEFILGKKRIMVKPAATKYIDGEPVFDPDDLSFYVLPEDISDDGAVITQIDMTLRTNEHTTGIQTQLNLLSSKCGFGETYYRFDGGNLTTATQVISENSTMFRTIKKHEIILEQAIRELCRIILRLGNIAMDAGLNEDAKVTIDFDDSIIEDKTTERNNDRQDLAAGIMNDWEYRMKWYNEDEKTAKKMLPRMEDMTDEEQDEVE